MSSIKKRIVIYIVCGLVAVLVIGGIIINSTTNANSPARLLSLGEKYLSELDYEQALVQFLKIIEIEPMNERAYLDAAESYIGLGQTDEAIAILEQGIEATGSEEMHTLLLELTESEEPTEPMEESQPEDEPEPSIPVSEDYMPADIAALFEQAAAAFQQEDYDAVTQIAYNAVLVEFLRNNRGAKYGNVTGEAFGNVDACVLGYANVDVGGNGYGICLSCRQYR
jgi:tetratricopeptide (TPR) repeat protein